MAYDYINQSIRATCLIEPKDDDSFYNPATLGHSGFAWDGTLYIEGVQQITIASPPTPVYASWATEASGAYRGDSSTFPQAGLVLLSRVALTILDETTSALKLWMQFLLQSNVLDPVSSPPVVAGSYALTDNFNGELNGWLPSGLAYADGVLSVTYSPDAGNRDGVVTSGSGSPPVTNYNIDSNMVVNIDFTQDKVYLDVALDVAV